MKTPSQRASKVLSAKGKKTPPPPPQDVGNAVVRGIWELYYLSRHGKLDVQKACRLTYMLSEMGRAYERSELDRRVRELERLSGGLK